MFYIKMRDLKGAASSSDFLYYPGDSKYCIYDSQLTQTIDEVGHLEFSVPVENIRYSDIKPYSLVWVYRDDSIMWAGYVSQIDKDMYNNLRVYCLEDYAMFNDYIYYAGASTKFYDKSYAISGIINTYNRDADTVLTFTKGDVDTEATEDSYDFILRKYDNLLSKLREFKSSDCFIRMEWPDEATRKINVLFPENLGASTQTIEFGKNMLEYVESMDTSELYNNVYYYGKVDTFEEPFEDVVTAEGSIALYGKHDGYFELDNVADALLLFRLASKYLDAHRNPKYIFEVTALDLSDLGADIDHINLGNEITVIAEQYGINEAYRISEIVTYLQQPERNTYTISGSLARNKTLTQMMKGK